MANPPPNNPAPTPGTPGNPTPGGPQNPPGNISTPPPTPAVVKLPTPPPGTPLERELMREEEKELEKQRWWRVGVGIAPFFIIYGVLWYTFSCFGNATLIIHSASAIITSLVYFPIIFPACTVKVEPNEAWVLSNIFKSEVKVMKMQFSGFRKISFQRELQTGFHWKYLWEELVSAVNMIREIKIESDTDRTYSLQGGKPKKIQWLVVVTVLPGYVVHFTRTELETIKARLKARIEKTVQAYVGSLNDLQYGTAEFIGFQTYFLNTFNGPWDLDDEELALGVWTSLPEILDIGDTAEAESGFNFITVMEAIMDVSKKLEDLIPGISKERAWQYAALSRAWEKADEIDYVALAGLYGGGAPAMPQAGPGQGGRGNQHRRQGGQPGQGHGNQRRHNRRRGGRNQNQQNQNQQNQGGQGGNPVI